MTDQRQSAVSRAPRFDAAALWPSIFATIFAVLIFIPVGLSMLGLIEEWDILYYFTKFGLFFIADAASPLPLHRLRPLTVAPFSIAYVLSPNSIVPYHVMHAAALILKAAAVGAITQWIFRNRRLSVIASIVFLLYPADTMQLSLRAFHINWALALTVLAIALFLDATERSGTRRLLQLLAATLAFSTASLIYEAGLFLAPLPLIFWFARFGWREGLRRIQHQATPILMWCLGIGIAAGYLVVASMTGSNYQMSVTGDQTAILHDLAARIPFLFTIAFYRLFAYGWYDGLRMMRDHPTFWPWLFVAFGCIAGLFFLIRRLPTTANDIRASDGMRIIRIAIAGIIAAFFGYLPYLSSFPHIMTSQRTYLYAAVGATVTVVAIIDGVGRIRQGLAFLLVLLCVTSGLGAQWFQLSVYTELSNRQRLIIAGILQAAPDAARTDSKRLMIVDKSGTMASIWMLRGDELRNALTFLYGADVDPLVCSSPNNQFSSLQLDALGRPSRCVESATQWLFGEGLPNPISIAKSDLQVLIVEPDLRVDRLTPTGETTPSPSTIQRWSSLLGCWPASTCTIVGQDSRATSFQYEFGKYWGLDDVPWGAGWRDIEWDLPSRQPKSWSWMVAPEANLYFLLSPQAGRYQVRVLLYYWISADAKSSMKISMNGKPLDATWADARTLTAWVDAKDLRTGLNELGLSAPLDPQLKLSVAVDDVSVYPSPAGADESGKL